MGNLVYINIESFLHDDIVYAWDRSKRCYTSHEYWNSYRQESFHYEYKSVPKGAHILRYHIVKGGKL